MTHATPLVALIDDELEYLEICESILAASFRVVTFENPKEALESFNNARPDIIVCDINMPQMNGIDVLAAVRTSGLRTPFIIVSGNADREVAINCLNLGAYALIEKPFDANLFLTTVNRAMSFQAIIDIAEAKLKNSRSFAIQFDKELTFQKSKIADLRTLISEGSKNQDEISNTLTQLEQTLSLQQSQIKENEKQSNKLIRSKNKFTKHLEVESLVTANRITRIGTKSEVAVVFTDIRHFTEMSENYSAEVILDMLNEYFSTMVDAIMKNNGVVDKFIGDSILAVWGAPMSTGDDKYQALKACLDMRLALDKLNQERESAGKPTICMGMGLHSGEAISGTVGPHEAMEYTVVGPTVNIASRIQETTKEFGVDLLVSEPIESALSERALFSSVGPVKVKGKSSRLSLFRVDGLRVNGQDRIIKTNYSEYEPIQTKKVSIA